MPSKAVLLADTLLKQDEILSELLDNTLKQREALKGGRLSVLQDLMSGLRHVSVRCQAIETKRTRSAEDLSRDLGCAAVVSDIVSALRAAGAERADEAQLIEDSAKKMMETVKKLKMEMAILARLMEEAKTLNEMLISEWQKLGQKFLGVGAMGTFDTRI
ncbi:MAG: flagellar biosynthesis protein FlgN [Synergistaceae bacterium]|jgi:predicted RNase H-like nuclease (RuvC/YqgF family)|nr:flagellar biosynthesis protein FlgN [Synergistaceae bacterium]